MTHIVVIIIVHALDESRIQSYRKGFSGMSSIHIFILKETSEAVSRRVFGYYAFDVFLVSQLYLIDSLKILIKMRSRRHQSALISVKPAAKT